MRVVTRTRTAAAAVCAAVVVAVTGGAGSAEALVERGARLVTTVASCGNCHTPRNASGKPMANMTLADGFEFDDGPIGHVVVPNMTPASRQADRTEGTPHVRLGVTCGGLYAARGERLLWLWSPAVRSPSPE